MAALPSFFEHHGTTVLDALIGEDETGHVEDDNGDTDLATFGADAFGDLTINSLPDFFATPKMADLGFEAAPNSAAPAGLFSTPVKMAPPPGMEHMGSAARPIAPSPSTMPPPGLMNSAVKPAPQPVPPSAPPIFSSPLKSLQEFAPLPLPSTPTIAPKLSIPASTPAQSPPPGMPIAPVLSTPRLPIAPQLSTPSTPFSEAQGGREFYGRGQYMSASDVRFVAHKVLQTLETSDVYADDFYFLQFNLKKNLAAREAAARESRPPPQPMQLPLPTWRETKERIRQQMTTSKQFFETKTREWEAQEQVLGHRIRTDVTRPKALLSLPSVHDLDFDVDNEDDSEWKAPFSTRLWTTRQAVQKGYEALYTVQELQNLASSPSVGSLPLAMEEIRKEMETAVSLLSEALGVWQGDQSCSLDGRHVAAIMQTVMGRKLLCRGLKLLSPQQRWALVPVVLARVLMAPATPAPLGSTATVAAAAMEVLAVERKLLRTVGEFVQYCYQTHLQGASLSAASDSSARELLGHLRQCVKNVIISHMEKKSLLRETLQSEKVRAEVMHLIVQVGENISLETDAQTAEEWTQTKDAFMAMLDGA